jgi:hypothetical protein
VVVALLGPPFRTPNSCANGAHEWGTQIVGERAATLISDRLSLLEIQLLLCAGWG